MKKNKWYYETGTLSEIVPSTRIRLARNLKRFPFENKITKEQQDELIQSIKLCLEQMKMGDNSFRYLHLHNMSQQDIFSLLEKHLISPDLINKKESAFVAISEDDSVSIMINEEDHIRIQVIKPGFSLQKALDLANKIDDYFDGQLDYAFDGRLGFLTACPTNLGTGLRASVMIHLPALQQVKAIQQLSNTLGKLGLTIRGSYGEGTTVQGDMYTVSNQITLGISEENAIKNLQTVVEQIVEKEKSSREALKQNLSFVDSLYRSYGILKYAKIISGEECGALLSRLRLGVSLDLFDTVTLEQINRIEANYMPSSICRYRKKELSAQERDRERAKMVQEILN